MRTSHNFTNRCIATIFLLVMTPRVSAGILGHDGFCISFGTNSNCHRSTEGTVDSSSGTTESDAGMIMQPHGQGWLVTSETAVGLAYRATCFATVSVRAEVDDQEEASSLQAYASYGCDRWHWSDWKPPLGSKYSLGGGVPQLFLSDIEVNRDEVKYFQEQVEKLGKPKKDTVWGSDAFFRWVAACRPELFEQVVPAIGYIRIKVTNPSSKPITLKRIDVDVSWYVSGLHQAEEPFDSETPWHFDFRTVTSQPTSPPTSQTAGR